MKVYLIIGDCGSGKTWVLKQLIEKLKLNTLGKIGMFYFHRNDKIVCLGKYDGNTFEGSDKLSMAVMRDIEDFKKYVKNKVVICEGDRFMNNTFVSGMAPNISILHITDDGKVGRKKRKSSQTERQLKTIHTRVTNIAKGAKHVFADSKTTYEFLLGELKSV